MSRLLIRGARQLLTLNGPAGLRRGEAMNSLGLIEDGAVLISDGVISSVGPTRRIENLAEAKSAREINAAGRVVMPAFVDSRTHPISGPRQTMRDLPARTLEFHARRVLTSALRHGTATIEARSGVGLDQSGEIKLLRMYTGLKATPLRVVPTCYAGPVMPPSFQNREEYGDWILETLLPLVSRWKAAKVFDVLCGPDGFNLLWSSRMLSAAARHGLRLKLSVSTHGQSDAIRLAVQRMVCSIDGITSVEEEDADVLAASNTAATLLPAAAFLRNEGPNPVARTLIDRGAAVALATGFHRSELPTHSMQMAIALAYSHWNMSPAEAITAATINSAHALMVADRCGSLQFGKDADIIILNTSDYRDIAYHFGVNFVQCTMRQGSVVYQEGEVDWPEKL